MIEERCIYCKRIIEPGEPCILLMNTEIAASGQAIPIIAVSQDGFERPDLPEETRLIVACSDECVRDHYIEKTKDGE